MQNQRQRPSLTINSKKAANVPAPPAITPGGGRNPYQTPHASTSNFGLYQLGGSSLQTPNAAAVTNPTTTAAFANMHQNPITPVTPFARNNSHGSTSSPSYFQLHPPNTPAAFQRNDSKVSITSTVEDDDFDAADESRNNIGANNATNALYGKTRESTNGNENEDGDSEHDLSLYSQSSLADVDTLNENDDKSVERIRFSRIFDILLYNNYQTYISNPQITPFSGRYPPSGVVSVVAKESLRIALEKSVIIELNALDNSKFTAMNISSFDYSALMGQVRHRLIELCSNGIDPVSGYNNNGSSINLRNSSVASLNSLQGGIIANNNNVEGSLSKLSLNKNLIISTNNNNNQSNQFRSPMFSPVSQTFSPITTVFNNNPNSRFPVAQDNNNGNNILLPSLTNDDTYFANSTGSNNNANNNCTNFNNVLLSSMGGPIPNPTSNRTHADFVTDPLTPITPVGIYPPYLSNRFIGNRSPEVNHNNNAPNSPSATNSPSNVNSSPPANPISSNVIQINDGNDSSTLESSTNSDRSVIENTENNPSTATTSELSLSSPFKESFELHGTGNNNAMKFKQKFTSTDSNSNSGFIKNSTIPGKSSKLKLSTTSSDTLVASNDSSLGKPPTLIVQTENKDNSNNGSNIDGLLSPAGINLKMGGSDNRLGGYSRKTKMTSKLRRSSNN